MPRRSELNKWLVDHGARLLWAADVRRVGTVTMYMVFRTLILVIRYDDNNGWDLMVPATPLNSIEAALKGAEEALKR